MSAAQSSLRAAIHELYRVFSKYHVHTLTGCPHCTSEEEGRRLVSIPLRELSAEDLQRYSCKAMTTWGSVEDYKHFLPRLFELAAANGLASYLDLAVLFSKPKYGEWERWPAVERRAVEGYFAALWLDLLKTYPHALEADSCLCAIGQSVADLSNYLSAWERTDSLSAARHLADLIDANQLAARRELGMRNAFWQTRAAQAEQIWQWLLRPERKVQLERAFFAAGEDIEVASQLSDAGQMLETIHQVVAAARAQP
jgi:hypothetical protein